jgi:phosphate transport system protein
MRRTFDKDLRELQDEVLVLGDMVGKAVIRSVEALKARDHDASRDVVQGDAAINEKRFAIEADCLRLIATQQPMARDLRSIAAVLEIITDLERIGDYASGVARINIMMGHEPLIKPLIDVPRMAELVVDMLHRALVAFSTLDVEAARAIALEDDAVDSLYDQVYRELLTFMMADPHAINQATHLLWVTHNLERVGDRVTNICERVVFTATGEMREMNKDQDDKGVE